LHATDSALYVPVGAALQIVKSDLSQQLGWLNGWYGYTAYFAALTVPPVWNSGSYPVTDENGWKIGSVPATPSAVPEIDPATGGSALSLVAGVLAMIEQRRRRATLVA